MITLNFETSCPDCGESRSHQLVCRNVNDLLETHRAIYLWCHKCESNWLATIEQRAQLSRNLRWHWTSNWLAFRDEIARRSDFLAGLLAGEGRRSG